MTFKENDVIEFTLSISDNIPDEDWENKTVCTDDYDREYEISYVCSDGSMSSASFTVEAGYSVSFSDDIKECVKEEIEENYKEIKEYEIFDVSDDSWNYQSAKVRVLSTQANEE